MHAFYVVIETAVLVILVTLASRLLVVAQELVDVTESMIVNEQRIDLGVRAKVRNNPILDHLNWLLESIARGYGYRYGKLKKVRVNTISQSPTKTTAGSGIGGFDSFYNFAEALSPLGNASAEACADYIVTMFSDLTRMVTMQNLFHDGGYSFTGISEDIMEKFKDL